MGWLESARFTQRSVRMVVLKSLLEEKLNIDPVSLFPPLQPIFYPTPEDVSISYLPLAHMFERVVQVSVLCAEWVGKGIPDLLIPHLFKSQRCSPVPVLPLVNQAQAMPLDPAS